jgi:chromosome segregation ATPase
MAEWRGYTLKALEDFNKELGQLRDDQRDLDDKVDHMETNLSEKIDNNHNSLSELIEDLEEKHEERMSEMRKEYKEDINNMKIKLGVMSGTVAFLVAGITGVILGGIP